MSIRGKLSERGHFGREPLGSGAMAQIDSIPCQPAVVYPMFVTLASKTLMLHKTLLKKGKNKNEKLEILCIPRLAEKL